MKRKDTYYLTVIGLFILILLYMQFCNKPAPGKTIIQPAKEKIVERDLQDAQRKHIYDSFEVVLKKDYAKDYKNEGYLINLLNENSRLVAINEGLQNITYPDTCKPVVTLLNNRYKEYVTQTAKTLAQTKVSISGLNKTVSDQKKYLAVKDVELNKVVKARDSCISDYAKLEKSSNNRGIIIGASALSRYDLIKKIDVGVIIGYSTKNRTTFTIGVYTNKQVTITLSKPLWRF
jgi:hypothetical protein